MLNPTDFSSNQGHKISMHKKDRVLSFLYIYIQRFFFFLLLRILTIYFLFLAKIVKQQQQKHTPFLHSSLSYTLG